MTPVTPPRIYAHRGWHGAGVPENTMAAFRRAAAAGHGIETDLRTDADGTVILFHDRVVGDAPVDRLARAAIEQRVGHSVPTLEDLLAADLGIPLNLELKTRAAAAALAAYLPRLPAGTLLSSFVHPVAADLADRHALDAALLLASAPEALPAPRAHLRTIVWDFNIVDPALLDAAAAGGWRNIVYGPRTPDEHAALRAWRCHAVITDTPDLA